MLKIDDYLTIHEAAEFLGVVPNTLRNWDKVGKIKAYRNPQNQYRLYRRDELEALLNSIRPAVVKE